MSRADTEPGHVPRTLRIAHSPRFGLDVPVDADVAGAKAAWQATRNRLYGFMTETYHSDLQVLAANASAMQPLEIAAAA